MTKQEFYLPSSDGLNRLHVQEWIPDGAPVGVIQLVHGICEYVDRYDGYAHFLVSQGWYVVGDDHLGHGKTAKSMDELGFTAKKDGWKLMVDDLERLRVCTREKYPELPYVMLGHSMGSFLTRTYLCRYPGKLDGCILSGTGQNPGIVLWAGKLLSRLERRRLGDHGRSSFLDNIAFGAFNNNFQPVTTGKEWLSRDPAVGEAAAKDPYASFIATTTLLGDMMEGLQFIWRAENLNRMDRKLPILFYAGDMDPVGSQGKNVKKVYERFLSLGCQDVTLKLYPGGRHEMHNETNKEELFADVERWLREKVLKS